MNTTLTTTQETAIRDWLDAHPTLAVGVGDEHSACSIAAINLALSGELTDNIPACMSEVIGRWIIGVQDLMPDATRNSDAWRDLLPLAAGTGRDHESERLTVIMHWLWETVLPILQPLAEKHGFGTAWRTMCAAQTAVAAHAAKDAAIDAAHAAAKYDAHAANYAAEAAEAAADHVAYDVAIAANEAALAAEAAANAAANYDAFAANYDADAAAIAADHVAYDAAIAANEAAIAAAHDAAFAADAAAHAAANYVAPAAAIAAKYAAIAAPAAVYVAGDAAADAYDDVWATIDPVGLLQRLIAVTDDRALGAAA